MAAVISQLPSDQTTPDNTNKKTQHKATFFFILNYKQQQSLQSLSLSSQQEGQLLLHLHLRAL